MEGSTVSDEAHTILMLKIIFIFLIFAISLFFGILPAKVKSCGRNPRFMSMANAFSGGLFLAIALVHILPDVVKDYNEWVEEHNPGVENAFPLPFVLVFAGYTFILIVDKVMFDSHALFDHGHGDAHGNGGGHGHKHHDEHEHHYLPKASEA